MRVQKPVRLPRVALSMSVEDHEPLPLQIGQIVEGKVTGVKPYGAFVRVCIPDSERKCAGLLHISQVTNAKVQNLEKVLPVGTRIKSIVISLDNDKGRVELSTKALEASAGQMLVDRAEVFANAEVAAIEYLERVEREKVARKAAAQDLILGLEEVVMGKKDSDESK